MINNEALRAKKPGLHPFTPTTPSLIVTCRTKKETFYFFFLKYLANLRIRVTCGNNFTLLIILSSEHIAKGSIKLLNFLLFSEID